MTKAQRSKLIFTTIAILLICLGTYFQNNIDRLYNKIMNVTIKSYNIDEIPEYNGKDFVVINHNEPEFKENEYTTKSFEKYSNLDRLGRCGVAYANLSKETMPKKERQSIGMIKPTGWHTVKYDNIESKYLYNRCHLIGYQLSGENDNKRNLITCTRQMNTIGMLQFENKVASHIKKTNNHVLYRVSPIFKENDLLARGVQIEAYSVEDKGKLKFNVFVYNVQDGIEIDYKTGASKKKINKKVII